MNERNYRKYSQEFKLEALELLQRGDKSAGQIERELGITPGMLVKWRARYQIMVKAGSPLCGKRREQAKDQLGQHAQGDKVDAHPFEPGERRHPAHAG